MKQNILKFLAAFIFVFGFQKFCFGQDTTAKLCVASPKTNLQPSDTAPDSLRNSLIKYLSGPAIEIVSLDSMVAVQQRAESVQKGCASYLVVTVLQKKSGGGEGIGGILRGASTASPLLDDIGAGKAATTVTNTAHRSAAKMSTAADLASGIKAKDEVTLEYDLVNSQTKTSMATGKLKAKAGKDGEDILSGLLEKSVNDILTAALK